MKTQNESHGEKKCGDVFFDNKGESQIILSKTKTINICNVCMYVLKILILIYDCAYF